MKQIEICKPEHAGVTRPGCGTAGKVPSNTDNNGNQAKAGTMAACASKAGLTPTRKCLVVMMQRLNFGRIEGLHVMKGEPVLDPPPRVYREVKFGRDSGPRPEVDWSDFSLKAEVVDLFAHLEEVGDGVITRLEVQHGLPFRMTCEEDVAG